MDVDVDVNSTSAGSSSGDGVGLSSTCNENVTESRTSGRAKVLKLRDAIDKTVEHCLSLLR